MKLNLTQHGAVKHAFRPSSGCDCYALSPSFTNKRAIATLLKAGLINPTRDAFGRWTLSEKGISARFEVLS